MEGRYRSGNKCLAPVAQRPIDARLLRHAEAEDRAASASVRSSAAGFGAGGSGAARSRRHSSAAGSAQTHTSSDEEGAFAGLPSRDNTPAGEQQWSTRPITPLAWGNLELGIGAARFFEAGWLVSGGGSGDGDGIRNDRSGSEQSRGGSGSMPAGHSRAHARLFGVPGLRRPTPVEVVSSAVDGRFVPGGGDSRHGTPAQLANAAAEAVPGVGGWAASDVSAPPEREVAMRSEQMYSKVSSAGQLCFHGKWVSQMYTPTAGREMGRREGVTTGKDG